MTIFGSDMSHYDDPLATRDGLDFFVHKAREGHAFYTDSEYAAAMKAARALGIPVLGAYFVLHPGSTADQVDFFLDLVNTATPWWREVPWIFQIDAEKFDYMSRAPSIAEINAFGDALVAKAGVPGSSVFAYAPKWLYGDQVSGLRYAIWASNYGSNPAGHYPDIYPGDKSTRWAAYGGKTPLILQYGSRATIAGQTDSDANGFRGSLDDLLALASGGDMALSAQDAKLVASYVWHDDTQMPTGVGDKRESGGTSVLRARDAAEPTQKAVEALTEDMVSVKAALARIEAALAGGGSAPGSGATSAEVTAIVDKRLDEHEAHEAAAAQAAADVLKGGAA